MLLTWISSPELSVSSSILKDLLGGMTLTLPGLLYQRRSGCNIRTRHRLVPDTWTRCRSALLNMLSECVSNIGSGESADVSLLTLNGALEG